MRAIPLATALFLATAPLSAQHTPERIDLLSFAHGVLPVAIQMTGNDLRTDMSHAIAAIDGNPRGFSATPKWGAATDGVAIVYALPAPTRFDRLAVPNVLETPSPSQTFFKDVEVFGAEAVDGPYAFLGRATLSKHEAKNQITELSLQPEQPAVSFVALRLTGGLETPNENTFFEFSEIIGNGVQAPQTPSTLFSGVWSGRGVSIELAQNGPTVEGCYDLGNRLTGTVDGRVLRALGEDDAGVESQFILIASADGSLRGLRSTNGAPFKPFDGEASSDAPKCLAPEAPKLGCGAIIHGLGFDYDSDALRPSSTPLLEALYDGLSAEPAQRVQIIGHSSSEGAADYNRDLSQRRAQSVVTALVQMGLDPARLSAGGKGEDEPIASNEDETGRSLNRRVEVSCAG